MPTKLLTTDAGRYILATAHISLSLTRLIQGFIKLRDVIDPVDYFASIFIRLNMAKDYLYITNVRVSLVDYACRRLTALSCSCFWETWSLSGDSTWCMAVTHT